VNLQLSVPVGLGVVVAIVAAGTAGLFAMDVMATDTILMMVLPSMVVFALVVFAIGVKAGEHRAEHRAR
jgi:hypothetical protein